MGKLVLAAAAVAAILTIGTPAQRAAAMTLAAPNQLGVAAEDSGLVQKAFVRCGYRGCVAAWRRPYWRWHHPYYHPYYGAYYHPYYHPYWYPHRVVVVRPWVHRWGWRTRHWAYWHHWHHWRRW
jgi:hypothetical protein